MDINLLQQLGLNGDVNQNDLKLLTNLMTQIQNGKTPKVTPQEKNKIQALMSKYGPKEEPTIPTKDIKDMTSEEREEHRINLKKKLREKTRGMANSRQPRHVIQQKMNNTTSKTTTNQASPNINSLQNLDLSNLTEMINSIQNVESKTDVEDNLENYLSK